MILDSGQTDFELLDLARSVMSEAGYEVHNAVVGDDSVLLIENEDNVAVVAAPVTLDHLFEAEPRVSRLLSERLVSGPPSRKRWDAFVVFLCAQAASADETEPISDLVNNLRFARRLVRIGVTPTKAAVSRSLRPLLPIPIAATDKLSDPLDELYRILLDDGLDPNEIQASLRDFEVSMPSIAAETANGLTDQIEMDDSNG